MPLIPSLLSRVAPLAAILVGGIGLGGGIYETLLIDSRWPTNLAIIQPPRGGINRGFFWAPVHALYELTLVVFIWCAWNDDHARRWTLAALAAHLAARVWSFAYFIPHALRFEQLNDLSKEQARLAHRWIRLSRCRPVIQAASLIALCGAMLSLRAVWPAPS